MLKLLIKKYSDCSTIYLSWDHASWHSSKVLFSEIDKVNDYLRQSVTEDVTFEDSTKQLENLFR